jgi:hypothetical protein
MEHARSEARRIGLESCPLQVSCDSRIADALAQEALGSAIRGRLRALIFLHPVGFCELSPSRMDCFAK